MNTSVHNPLKLNDFTFRFLPWRWRLRRELYRLDLRADFPQYGAVGLTQLADAVDGALDQAIWEGGRVFTAIRAQLNGYIQSPDPADAVKRVMLAKALDATFAGHAKSLNHVPHWMTYAARVSTPQNPNRTELVLFEAESDDMAMDLVLDALLKMQELKQVRPNYVWNLMALFYKRDQKYHLPSVDVDLTNAFWERASGLLLGA